MATRYTVTAIGLSLFPFTGLTVGTASAQYPIGQGQVPVYSPPPVPQPAPVWSAPVTGHPAPYMPPPQSSYIPAPVYSGPVTGTVNPYSRAR